MDELDVKNNPQVRSVGELREALADLPANMPLAVLGHEKGWNVWWGGVDYAVAKDNATAFTNLAERGDQRFDLPNEFPNGLLTIW